MLPILWVVSYLAVVTAFVTLILTIDGEDRRR